jgi:peptide/nickel transport system substrate-binding protein
MSERVDHTRQNRSQVTRRGVLKTGLLTAVGLGGASLAAVEPRVAIAAPEGKRGGHGYVLNYAYPESWDPHISGTLAANAAISPMYNQVVEFNPLNPKEVIGDLARGWEVSEDGKAYTFQLHDHVQWWDGRPLTAEDVAFSINRMIEPDQPRPRVGLLRPSTKRAEAVDPHTVRVHLNYASPSFLPFLAVDYMKVVPKHVVEAGTDINQWKNIVGSGPFKIVRARRGDSVTYERNPNYFKPGLPYLDQLTVLAMSDAGTAAAAIKANKIIMTTAATALSIEDMVKLGTDLKGQVSLYWQPEVTDGWHVFANVEREPWTDLRIIQALRLATDQQEHQKAFGEGHYKMGAPFPVDSWYGSTSEALLNIPGYRQPKDQDIADAHCTRQK